MDKFKLLFAEYAEYKAEVAVLPELYVKYKVKSINRWCIENRIDSFVVGISGGIDSAVVYKLLKAAQTEPDSPIKLISAVTIPISGSVGTTGQSDSLKRALELEPNVKIVNIGNEVNTLFATMCIAQDTVSDITTDNLKRAKGQFDYMVRPAVLYGEVAILQGKGYSPVICNTINACELFLGFFGKKSDTCDVGIIYDLMKSDVYAVAKYLEVPDSIIDVKPRGDVFTNQTDEELIGASYEMIETFMYLCIAANESAICGYYDSMDFKNILRQRLQNTHKFVREPDFTKIGELDVEKSRD